MAAAEAAAEAARSERRPSLAAAEWLLPRLLLAKRRVADEFSSGCYDVGDGRSFAEKRGPTHDTYVKGFY